MFIGRKEEIAFLQGTLLKGKSQLTAVYGRRRVGKTVLVEKAFENNILWKFEGLEGAFMQKQIRHFLFTLSQYTKVQVPETHPIVTWEEALLFLNKCLKNKNVVLFFDEFQWMANMRNQLVSSFKWAYDNYFSKNNLSVIICGSVSSFIVKNVVRSKALYGRIDNEINLCPFNIREINEFFNGKRTYKEIIDIYMSLGGIPQYLLKLNSKYSVIQNINEMAFMPNGYFFYEYQKLFISHFAKNKIYEKIVNILSHSKIISTVNLAKKIKIKRGGTFTNLIDDLELAGFIEKFYPIDKDSKSRNLNIRISDEFIHFYYTFIEKNKVHIENRTLKGFELLTGPKFDQWRGYAFERVIRKHAKDIAKVLGFSGIRYEYGSWFKSKDNKTTQIDLLFKRADGVWTICEIKYVNDLKTSVVLEFEKKILFLKEYHNVPMQKILICANKIKIPEKIEGYFDEILFGEEILLK